MKAIFLLFLIMLSAICPVPSRAFSDENNLLIEHLDMALDRTEEFAAVREQNISKLRLSLKKATTDSARLEAARELFEANRIFDGDSAMYYGNMCLALAKDIRRPDMQDDINIMSAYTLAAMGLFDESRLALSRVRVDSLSVDQMIEYLGKKVYLITHIESYHRLEGEPGNVKADIQPLLDSIASVIPDSHPDYILYKAYAAMSDENRAAAAVSALEPRAARLTLDAQRDARAAWAMSQLYLRLGDEDNYIRYLIMSALADARIANREIASLEELAVVMDSHGDIVRAARYISHCLECARMYKNRVRMLRLASLQSYISKKTQDRMTSMQRRTLAYLAIVALLALVLTASLVIIYRHRNRLRRSNANLAENNCRLQTLSEALARANADLAEADRAKHRSLGEVFSVCSRYIDLLEEFRRNQVRLLKDGKAEMSLRQCQSPKFIQELVKEFNDKFDALFLASFPNFVADFNALLLPEARIEPKKEGSLNTELRIYALVRLGITDSITIASVLHCSVRTVYNRRLEVRNLARIPRDSFDAAVAALGTQASGL